MEQQQQQAGTLRFALSGAAQIKAFKTAVQSLAKIGACFEEVLGMFVKRSRCSAANQRTHTHTQAPSCWSRASLSG
jgi:hypothetical protein